MQLLERGDPQRIPLGDLGRVRGGYLGSEPTRNSTDRSGFRILQASDIASDGSVLWSTLHSAPSLAGGERYMVSERDVLLPLRSVRVDAIVAHDVPRGVIAAGHWAIISPDLAMTESDFLAWYLNHPRTRARLAQFAQGTNLQFLSLNTVRSFEIELPSLDLQRRIAHVHALNERVMQIEHQLTGARSELVDALTMGKLHPARASHR